MQNAITTIFCHVDDFLKALSWKDDPQCRLSLAEVITIGLTSSRFFGGNLESARAFLAEHQYIPNILSKSRLNRRLHAIPDFFWHLLVEHLCSLKHPECNVFLVDSFPVAQLSILGSKPPPYSSPPPERIHHQKPKSTLCKKALAKWGAVQP